MDRILVLAATSPEIECIRSVPVSITGTTINKLVGGIGSVSTVYSLMNYLAVNGRPDVVINIGIAGSYREDLTAGSVVAAETDCFADLGVYDGNKFIPMGSSGLRDFGDKITPSGIYGADTGLLEILPSSVTIVKGVTVNAATGSTVRRQEIESRFKPDIETMEGAAVYYVGKLKGIPCIGIRSISNMVGPRDKSLWDTGSALANLGEIVSKYINDIIL